MEKKGKMVQFDAIKFRRTFKNYFGQFVWIEKKATSTVAFHFIKRRLKMNFVKSIMTISETLLVQDPQVFGCFHSREQT